MNPRCFLLLSMLLLVHVSYAQKPAQVATKAALIEEFEANATRFVAALEGLSSEQWHFQESPDRWSIAQVAEHIIKAEAAQRSVIIDSVLSTHPDRKAENPSDTDNMIATVTRDRGQKFQAPDFLQPEGVYSTPSEALAAFKAARETTLELLRGTDKDLRAHFADHPFGRLDAYQWLLFMVSHADRHLAQIAQVKAHTKYPQ